HPGQDGVLADDAAKVAGEGLDSAEGHASKPTTAAEAAAGSAPPRGAPRAPSGRRRAGPAPCGRGPARAPRRARCADAPRPTGRPGWRTPRPASEEPA